MPALFTEEALAHPYLSDFQGQMPEPSCKELFDFDFEHLIVGVEGNPCEFWSFIERVYSLTSLYTLYIVTGRFSKSSGEIFDIRRNEAISADSSSLSPAVE